MLSSLRGGKYWFKIGSFSCLFRFALNLKTSVFNPGALSILVAEVFKLGSFCIGWMVWKGTLSVYFKMSSMKLVSISILSLKLKFFVRKIRYSPSNCVRVHLILSLPCRTALRSTSFVQSTFSIELELSSSQLIADSTMLAWVKSVAAPVLVGYTPVKIELSASLPVSCGLALGFTSIYCS